VPSLPILGFTLIIGVFSIPAEQATNFIDSSIDSPVTRAISVGTTEIPPTLQGDRIINPSNSDPQTQVYKIRLAEDLYPNQMTVEETRCCNEVCGMFTWICGEVKRTMQGNWPAFPPRNSDELWALVLNTWDEVASSQDYI
jgi:hypothetical protein